MIITVRRRLAFAIRLGLESGTGGGQISGGRVFPGRQMSQIPSSWVDGCDRCDEKTAATGALTSHSNSSASLYIVKQTQAATLMVATDCIAAPARTFVTGHTCVISTRRAFLYFSVGIGHMFPEMCRFPQA